MKHIFYLLVIYLPILSNAQSKIFWSEFSPSSVKCLEDGGSEVSTILRDVVNRPTAITIDREGGYIYYANKGSKTINRCSLNGTGVVTLIDDIIEVQVIRIDHTNQKLYYGEVNVARIIRSDLDGSNEETIFSSNFGVGVYGLELDVENDKMYFSTYDDVYVSDLDAENPEIIVPDLTKGRNISLDRTNNKLYFLDEGFIDPPSVSRCDLDGSNVEVIDTEGMDEPLSMVIDYLDGFIYWAEEDLKSIMRADINGGNVQAILDLDTPFFSFTYSLAFDAINKRLYWTDTTKSKLQWINTATGEKGIILSDEINDPGEIIVDNINKKLYRTNSVFGIYKSDLDGANPEKIVESSSGSCIALTNAHLYYFSSSKDGIMRVNKDGTDETKIVNLENLAYVADIEVDEQNGLIFWMDSNAEQTYRSKMAGSEVEAIAITSFARSFALDPSSQLIYYTSASVAGPASNTITTMNYNGENKEVIANAQGSHMGWITIDTMTQRVFWTEGNGDSGVFSMNLDGSDQQLIQSSENALRGIAYYNDNVTATEDLKFEVVNIFPLPAQDLINIESAAAIKSISVIEVDGTLVSQSNFSRSIFTTQIDLASRSKGNYILNIEFVSGHIESRVVQKL